MALQLSWVGPCKKDGVSGSPKANGVYVLWVSNADRGWYAYYIGEGDIHDRLTTHYSDHEPDECIKRKAQFKGRYSYALTPKLTRNQRRGVERALIEHYETLTTNRKGGCNDLLHDVQVFDVTLPDVPG
ncbi:MAG: hypothetical protein GXP55_22675 [Deltaproteobacteria bacterium]|nr:hypothetical protein [Deltaproteobacteria bacterium]